MSSTLRPLRARYLLGCPQVSTNTGVAGQREVGGPLQHHHPATAQPRPAGETDADCVQKGPDFSLFRVLPFFALPFVEVSNSRCTGLVNPPVGVVVVTVSMHSRLASACVVRQIRFRYSCFSVHVPVVISRGLNALHRSPRSGYSYAPQGSCPSTIVQVVPLVPGCYADLFCPWVMRCLIYPSWGCSTAVSVSVRSCQPGGRHVSGGKRLGRKQNGRVCEQHNHGRVSAVLLLVCRGSKGGVEYVG